MLIDSFKGRFAIDVGEIALDFAVERDFVRLELAHVFSLQIIVFSNNHTLELP